MYMYMVTVGVAV